MPIIPCHFCGTFFEKPSHKIQNSSLHFCSNRCQGNYESLVNVKNDIGKTYGHLKILELVGSNEENRSLVNCLCNCGRETIKIYRLVKSGKIKKCGKCSGETLEERLRYYSKKNNKTGCLEWTGALNHGGYGIISCARKTKFAHRVAWELKNGEIPNGMIICHHCDNPCCINVEHLFLGTDALNSQDKVKKGRQGRSSLTGEKCGSAKLKNSQVHEIRRLFLTGKYKMYFLAKKFNVSDGTISMIVNNKTWRNI